MFDYLCVKECFVNIGLVKFEKAECFEIVFIFIVKGGGFVGKVLE